MKVCIFAATLLMGASCGGKNEARVQHGGPASGGQVAQPGTAAPVSAPVPALPRYDTVTVTLRRTLRGAPSAVVYTKSYPVASLGQPLSYVVRALPQAPAANGATPAPKKPRRKRAGGMLGGGSPFGGLGGGAVRRPAAGPLSFQPAIELGGATTKLPAFTCPRRSGCVIDESIEFRLTGQGLPPRTTTRTLRHQKMPHQQRNLPLYRRYTVAVLADAVSDADAKRRAESARAQLSRLSEAERVVKAGEQSKDRTKLYQDLLALDPGAWTGYLAALRFAAASDTMTKRLATAYRVHVQRPVPRILIATIESRTRGRRTANVFGLDLRLDEVHATAKPGAKPNAARAFQFARGIAESNIEGAVVAELTGTQPVTTVRVMSEAARRKIAPVLLTSPDPKQMRSARLRGFALRTAKRALEAGRQLVVIPRGVRVAGAYRQGWWDIDPKTGAAIGVMDDGQHQAMTSTVTTHQKIALNPQMGFVFGLMAGSMYVQFAIASKILEGKPLTDAVKKEIKAGAAQMACSACPTAGASGTSASVGNDCFNLSETLGSWSADMAGMGDFCGRYQAGVKCAVATMLASMSGELPEVEGSVSSGSAHIGCAKIGN